MIAVSVTINGIEQAIAQATRLTSLAPLRAPMEESVAEIETWMKFYPPPPPAIQGPQVVPVRTFKTKGGALVRLRANKASGKGISLQKASTLRYVRTGKLGQSWTNIVTGDDNEITGKVGTNINYAPYVQSAARQAAVHVGRWRTDTDAVQQFREKIIARFRAALEATR